jgi:hypothetical protein
VGGVLAKEPAPAKRAKPAALTALQKKANAAIDRGVVYLKAVMGTYKGLPPSDWWRWSELFRARNPTFTTTPLLEPVFEIPAASREMPALIGLTLLACGVPANDPAVQKAAALTRDAAPTLRTCYSLSVAVLFLDRLGQAQDAPVIETMGLRLVASQTAAGGWDYMCLALNGKQQQQLLDYLKDPDRRLDAALAQLPVVRYRPGRRLARASGQGGDESAIKDDNSNTQFACLALWAASRHGVPIERTFAMVDARFRGTQQRDGSWRYAAWKANRRDSSTCAGLLGLAVGHTQDQSPHGQLSRDPAVKKGLAFLGKALRRGRRPGAYRGKIFGSEAWGDLYFLWSLERVAVIYGLEKIGSREWYPWGAKIIVARQRKDGSWAECFPGIPDTCFCLLFLKRANVVPDLTSKLQELESSASRFKPDPRAKKNKVTRSPIR